MNDCGSDIWHGEYKIPWHEPEFSRRMLAEHLTQDHDLASRRTERIERQVAWIHDRLLGGEPRRVLDLGCGPGLYANRLARLGHRCVGIDFGPASIDHARGHNEHTERCRFELGDLRTADFSGPHDLAMILYGELNVFSPAEAAGILSKARQCLAPSGAFVAEVQTARAVEAMGRADPAEHVSDGGLFFDGPHTWRAASRWLAEHSTAVQTFEVREADGRTRTYRSTTRAWSDAELRALFAAAGFARAEPDPAWPAGDDDLVLWVAPCG